jgi:hypothetical protein
MSKQSNERIASRMIAQISKTLVAREPPEPSFEYPQGEAFTLEAEVLDDDWIEQVCDRLPPWISDEVDRFLEGVTWAEYWGHWNPDEGMCPSILHRFARTLRQMIAWWQDEPESVSESEPHGPEDTNPWLYFGWESGDPWFDWYIHFPENTQDELRFNRWRLKHSLD